MNSSNPIFCVRCGQPINGKFVCCPICSTILCEICAKELAVDEGGYYCPGCHNLSEEELRNSEAKTA